MLVNRVACVVLACLGLGSPAWAGLPEADLEKKCDSGDAYSCYRIAHRAERQDAVRCVRWYHKACLIEDRYCKSLVDALQAWLVMDVGAPPKMAPTEIRKVRDKVLSMVGADPGEPENRVALGAVRLMLEDRDAAIAAFDEARKVNAAAAEPDRYVEVLVPLGLFLVHYEHGPKAALVQHRAFVDKATQGGKRKRDTGVILGGLRYRLAGTLEKAEKMAFALAPNKPPSRDLPAGATFGGLVAVLLAEGRRVQLAGVPQETEACILKGFARKGRGGRIEAAAALGSLNPPDLAWLSFGEQERAMVYPDVFTPRGLVHGDRNANTWLFTLTPVSQSFATAPQVLALVVQKDQILVTEIRAFRNYTNPWSVLAGKDKKNFEKNILPRLQAAVVTADKDVPLTRVRKALAWLQPSKAEVALAVPTFTEPSLVRGPRRGRALDNSALAGIDRRNPPPGICPYGIMDVPKGKRPARSVSFKAIERFKAQAAKACAASKPEGTSGPVKLSMRLLRSGKVEKACVMDDHIGAAALRDCLVDRLKKHRFGRLTGGDFANVGLEVNFRAERLEPLCR